MCLCPHVWLSLGCLLFISSMSGLHLWTPIFFISIHFCKNFQAVCLERAEFLTVLLAGGISREDLPNYSMGMTRHRMHNRFFRIWFSLMCTSLVLSWLLWLMENGLSSWSLPLYSSWVPLGMRLFSSFSFLIVLGFGRSFGKNREGGVMPVCQKDF